MSRTKRRYRGDPAHFIPEHLFREVNEWLNRDILDLVIYCGGEGIEANDVVVRFQGARTALEGWPRLGAERQRKAIWRAINQLEHQRLIERYYSRQRGHNRSRWRLREVGILDRLVHALEQSDE